MKKPRFSHITCPISLLPWFTYVGVYIRTRACHETKDHGDFEAIRSWRATGKGCISSGQWVTRGRQCSAVSTSTVRVEKATDRGQAKQQGRKSEIVGKSWLQYRTTSKAWPSCSGQRSSRSQEIEAKYRLCPSVYRILWYKMVKKKIWIELAV